MLDQTTHAIGVDGEFVYFTDFVYEGEEVILWDDPETEDGFRGVFVVVKDGDDWRLREPTEEENETRINRLLAEFDKKVKRAQQ